MISKTNFETVLNLWKTKLWPDRKSAIESHSAMLINDTFDLKNFNYPATFFIYSIDGKIVGCNSGHMCLDDMYRSRGLYVDPNFRKQGIGRELLLATIEQGVKEQAKSIWSYPRYESWSTYKSAGFTLTSEWKKSETGINAYCSIPNTFLTHSSDKTKVSATDTETLQFHCAEHCSVSYFR